LFWRILKACLLPLTSEGAAMFAPKVPKAQTTALENSSSKMPQRSPLFGHRLGHDPVALPLFLQRTIGNQATLRLLAKQTLSQHGDATENAMTGETSRGASWDFSKIRLFPPDRASRGLSPLPSIIQQKLVVGQANDPLEHEADRVADQVMRMPATEIEPDAAPPQVSRKCAACEAGTSEANLGEAPAKVHEALRSPGRPLDAATRAHFEPRFGHDFNSVRIHTDQQAADAARDLAAEAFTVGEHIVFGKSQYAPDAISGLHLLAHELTHVVQQRAAGPALQRRAKNCPDKEPEAKTIKTIGDFISLVERVEADAGTRSDPIATARLIARTKYDDRAWDWLLPTTKGKPGVVQIVGDGPRVCRPGGQVTVDDIASLCFKLTVATPDGDVDPMHIIAAIVADAETLPAGTGANWLVRKLVAPLPPSVTQRAASTWVGDVGKAAAEWMLVFRDRDPKDAYWLANAPQSDLLANVYGVAMTSKSPVSGFAFDKTAPLSDNLRRFSRSGRKMEFHIFCDVERFALETNGVTLTAKAKAAIYEQIKLFAIWYAFNSPALKKSLVVAIGDESVRSEFGKRLTDYTWFADKFIAFVQDGLAGEK
jgi:hypothetical protein